MFNLLSTEWIPTSLGKKSLIDTLENARSIQITATNLHFASLIRLLLAACYQGGETSSGILKKGVGSTTLKALEKHGKMFNLYEGYMTCPDLSAKPTTTAKLFSGMPSGNTMVFHGHTTDSKPPPMTSAELALAALEFHCSAPAFGNSATGHRCLSPCADVVLGIAVGATLLETLALNLVPDPRSPTATWTRSRATERDFTQHTRQEAASIAERYTWLGQAIRFTDELVGTAAGFSLLPLGDPMSATFNTKKGSFVLRPYNLERWLLGCKVTGFGTISAATLAHATSLNIPHKVRVISQVSSKANRAKILERIDATFEPKFFDFELAARISKIRAYIVYQHSEILARGFVSFFEDQLEIMGGEFNLEDFISEYPHSMLSSSKSALLKLATS